MKGNNKMIKKNKALRIMSALSISLVFLTTPAHAKDPCATVLCMAGMVQGKGVVSGCSGPVKDYFSITKRKKGKFSSSRTSSARGSFLNSCSNNSGWASKINDQYGHIRSFGF